MKLGMRIFALECRPSLTLLPHRNASERVIVIQS